MNPLPELRPQDVSDFTVVWNPEEEQWVGKHDHSDIEIKAGTLRDLEMKACGQRILFEWRRSFYVT
jgi:hypothetical protein